MLYINIQKSKAVAQSSSNFTCICFGVFFLSERSNGTCSLTVWISVLHQGLDDAVVYFYHHTCIYKENGQLCHLVVVMFCPIHDIFV